MNKLIGLLMPSLYKWLGVGFLLAGLTYGVNRFHFEPIRQTTKQLAIKDKAVVELSMNLKIANDTIALLRHTANIDRSNCIQTNAIKAFQNAVRRIDENTSNIFNSNTITGI